MEIKNFIHSQGIQLLRKLVHHRNKFYTFSKQINKKFFKNNNIWSDNRDDKKHGGNNIKSQTQLQFLLLFLSKSIQYRKGQQLARNETWHTRDISPGKTPRQSTRQAFWLYKKKCAFHICRDKKKWKWYSQARREKTYLMHV